MTQDISEKLSESDPIRILIRKYMLKHPEEEDLSIDPERGIPSMRHEGLIKTIQIGVATGRYESNDYSSKEIYQLINEEQEKREN